MALRIPPGRAGRTWLVGRLEIARRGAELLDRKRQALLRERAAVRAEVEEARRAWHDAAAEVALWTARSSMLDGPARLELLTRHVDGQASVELSWANLMGARLPSVSAVALPAVPPLSALGRQFCRGDGRARLWRGGTRSGPLRGGGARRRRTDRGAQPRRPAAARAATALDTTARSCPRPARSDARREPARASCSCALAHLPGAPAVICASARYATAVLSVVNLA